MKYASTYTETETLFVGFLATGAVFPVVENPRAPKLKSLEVAIEFGDVDEIKQLLKDGMPVKPNQESQIKQLIGEEVYEETMKIPRKPIVHSLEGQAVVNGYDTHFVLVHQFEETQTWIPWCPGDAPLSPGTIEHTELVTFENNTIMPAFIIHFKN